MENYITIILTIIVLALSYQSVKTFFKNRDTKNFQAGMNQAVTQIYNQIKKTKKMDLILDGKKITMIEKVKNKKNKK